MTNIVGLPTMTITLSPVVTAAIAAHNDRLQVNALNIFCVFFPSRHQAKYTEDKKKTEKNIVFLTQLVAWFSQQKQNAHLSGCVALKRGKCVK